jgi:hypothetical protein
MWVGAVLLVPGLLRPPARAAGPSGPTFEETVARNFRVWDLNHDNFLEIGEIDRLMNAPSILGDDAAALATIKIRDRNLRAGERSRLVLGLDEPSGRVESELLEPAPGGGWRPEQNRERFPYEAQFRRFRGELAEAPQRLFAGSGPDFARLHQGPIGDCFFFSLTGCLAALHPRRIVTMIEPERDGAFLVRFPRRRPVRVPPLTQAEMLVNNSASTLGDGQWPVVLEKAVGELLREHARPSRRTAEATDAIANGGSTERMLHLYTGHASHDFTLRTPRGAVGRLREIRRLLPEALAHGRLAAVSMHARPASPAKIPGLGYDHAYAVLGYDRRSDMVTVWNPWGNTFNPKGPEGPAHGFITRHGVFHIPLTMLYHNFSSLHIESERVLPSGRG